MLDFIKDPTLDPYRRYFAAGETLLLEGDNHQDLLILVEGRLDIIKGQRKVSELSDPGSLFGEIAFILNRTRTTTVKASAPVEVLQIPSAEVEEFQRRFPIILPAIAKVLAKRLHEATQVRSGLQEFCDQLPEAMVMTDPEYKLLAWNTKAETLYGRSWKEMHDATLRMLFEDQPSFRQFLASLQPGHPIAEKTLKVNHPTELWKFVALNTTVMTDGHRHTQGYLLIGRDVTAIHRLHQKQQLLQKWLRPALALLLGVGVLFAFSYPDWHRGQTLLKHKMTSFREQLDRDQQTLSQRLAPLLKSGELAVARQLLADYSSSPAAAKVGISGLTLLNGKEVVVGATTTAALPANHLGNRYTEFTLPAGAATTPALLLPEGPASGKSDSPQAALAFPLLPPGEPGWLIFRLDLAFLEKEYGLDRKALTKMAFR